MTLWQWLLVIWGVGVPIGGALNVLMLLGSGGFVTRPLAILRNAILWPVMLPFLFGMYLQSRG